MRQWRIFTLLVMLMTTITCVAGGNISKKVKYMSGENGTVYFVTPMKMPKASDSKALKNLIYDITCLNSEDSLNLTATVISKDHLTFTEGSITADGMEPVTSKIELVYLDPLGNKYENRLRMRISRADFKKIYHNAAPFILDFGHGLRFGFKQKTWPKETRFMNDVFIMIDATT